jgi:putative FmdB family regulatory protein
MPTYDYECKACGHTFEAFQRITEDPLRTCPECSGEVRRLVGGGIGVIFKGSGFYVNDSRKSTTGSSSSSEKKESADAPKGESKDGSSDSSKSDSGTKESGKKESVSSKNSS